MRRPDVILLIVALLTFGSGCFGRTQHATEAATCQFNHPQRFWIEEDLQAAIRRFRSCLNLDFVHVDRASQLENGQGGWTVPWDLVVADPKCIHREVKRGAHRYRLFSMAWLVPRCSTEGFSGQALLDDLTPLDAKGPTGTAQLLVERRHNRLEVTLYLYSCDNTGPYPGDDESFALKVKYKVKELGFCAYTVL